MGNSRIRLEKLVGPREIFYAIYLDTRYIGYIRKPRITQTVGGKLSDARKWEATLTLPIGATGDKVVTRRVLGAWVSSTTATEVLQTAAEVEIERAKVQ